MDVSREFPETGFNGLNNSELSVRVVFITDLLHVLFSPVYGEQVLPESFTQFRENNPKFGRQLGDFAPRLSDRTFTLLIQQFLLGNINTFVVPQPRHSPNM